MASGFIDSLKLVLSDRYEISDSDYKTLSDILVNKGLSDRAFDSGLVEMIYLMIRYNHRFPISLTFLKELWEYENISYNFVRMLGDLLKNGVISLRKVKRETFFQSKNITKSNSEDLDKDLYVVIYGSSIFNDVFNEFLGIIGKDKSINESVSGTPRKLGDAIVKASNLLKNMNIDLDVESYVSDTALNTSRLNLAISETSKYSLKDADVQRKAKKHLKGSYILDVESYKEGNSELFLGIDMKADEKSYIGLADSIYSFLEELEVEGV